MPVGASVSARTKAQGELRSLAGVIEAYEISYGALPKTDWFNALKAKGLVHRTLSDRDPWGFPYVYRPSGDTFDVGSVGPDGEWGTSDDQVCADGWKCKGGKGPSA